MKGRRFFVFPALALALSCDDARHPTGVQKVERGPSEIILDGAHGGNPDFWFLPPMVPSPFRHADFELGKFNNALQPSLRIEICELKPEGPNGAGLPKTTTKCKASTINPNADAPPIKTFPAGTVNLVNLPRRAHGWWSLFNLPPDGFYYVLWNTHQSKLNVNKFYRIKVLLEGSSVPLGVADVDPMSSLRQWKHSNTGHVVQMIDDFLLPIPFRVEQGALCEGGDLCTSVTVDDNDGVDETVTLDGAEGTIAGAVFEDGTLPDGPGRPQSVVVTITKVNTGGLGFFKRASRQTQTGSTLCHPTLELQQFEGCFNFSTIPELAPIAGNEDGDQFLLPVRVAVCFELAGTEDSREPFITLYASDGEIARQLPEASDVGILDPEARNCAGSSPFGPGNDRGVRGVARSAWRIAKAGLDRAFGVKTAYALDAGLGGLIKRFSNISPVLVAEIEPVSETDKDVDAEEPTEIKVKVVGVPHHVHEEINTALPNMPVEFTLDPEEATCNGTIVGSEGGVVNKLTDENGFAAVSLAVTSGKCAVKALSKKARGGTKKFSATVVSEPEIPNPILGFARTEFATVSGVTTARYYVPVTNFAAYPAEMFAPAPNLDPCGGNDNSSRTWVDIYDASDDFRLFGFCALGAPENLQSLWFGKATFVAPPAQVYVKMVDRATGTTYVSNDVSIVPFDLTPSAPVVTPATFSSNGANVGVSGVTITNQGGSFDGQISVGVRYYLSADPIITVNDQLLFNTTITLNCLVTGGSLSLPTQLIGIAPLSVGTHYVGIVVDGENAFFESNEANNAVGTPVAVGEAPAPNNSLPIQNGDSAIFSMQTGATIQIANEGLSWTSSDPNKLQVSPAGLVTAIVGGESDAEDAHVTLTSALDNGNPGPKVTVNSFNFRRFPRVTTLAWKPVPGASHYFVETEFGNTCFVPQECETWTNTSLGTFTATSVVRTFEFVGAQPGRWKFTARSPSGVLLYTSPYIYFAYRN
ncbi:MAG TPA: hypothetical protein VNO75_07255 [Gemmatimonadaceae bacterium]|nr:hypothetical protein [Gemmatimonadaceae bacterium]